MWTALENRHDKFLDLLIYRFSFLGIILYQLGVAFDMRWHYMNPFRSHYFIIPHIIIYCGVAAILFGFFLLKLRKYDIPIWIFILFPLASVADEIWHNFFGVELSTSPLMFWSPAHWCFGVIIIYVLYILINLKIETNETLLDFVKAFFYAGMVGLIYYLLIPLSPYSIYLNLHTAFNVVVPVIYILLPVTFYKIIKSDRIFLLMLLLLANANTSEWNFFVGNDFVYNNNKVLWAGLILVFLFCISLKSKIISYILLSDFIICVFYLLFYMTSASFNIYSFVFSILIASIFSCLYYLSEEYFLFSFRRFFEL